MLTIDRRAVQYLVADTQQSSAHAAHFNSAIYRPRCSAQNVSPERCWTGSPTTSISWR